MRRDNRGERRDQHPEDEDCYTNPADPTELLGSQPSPFRCSAELLYAFRDAFDLSAHFGCLRRGFAKMEKMSASRLRPT